MRCDDGLEEEGGREMKGVFERRCQKVGDGQDGCVEEQLLASSSGKK